MRKLGFGVVAVLALGACSGGTMPPPDPESPAIAANAGALTEALAAALPGDVLRVEAGTITGSFRVPAGVTLEGAGVDATVLVGEAAESVLLVETAVGEVTDVSRLGVRSSATAGIIARGDGEARLTDIRVNASLGIAMGLEELAGAELTNIDLVGPVTEASVSALSNPPTRDETATHGLVAIRITALTVNDLSASGFGQFGALFIDSNTQWTGGLMEGNLGTGAMVFGGTADLGAVRVAGMLAGFGLAPSYGIVVSEADVTSQELNLAENDGVGLLQNASSGTHVDLSASANTQSSVWVQVSDQFELSGTGSLITGGRFAGVVVADSSNVLLSDAVIEGTEAVPGLSDTGDLVEVGDGIQLARSTDSIEIRNVTLADNARVGALLDLGGSQVTGLTLDAVAVDGTGTQLGFIGQNGTLPADWDSGITRLGDTQQNDLDFVATGGALGVVGIVGPSDFPAPTELETNGLDVLGVVTPSD